MLHNHGSSGLLFRITVRQQGQFIIHMVHPFVPCETHVAFA
jgi:hypothetical protein